MNKGTNLKRRINLTTPRSFVFKVVFDGSVGHAMGDDHSPLSGRSIVVEIEPDVTARTSNARSADKTARRFAEETAHWAALQTIQKDFPEGFEPASSAAPLDRLPDELRRRRPTLQTSHARAWLV